MAVVTPPALNPDAIPDGTVDFTDETDPTNPIIICGGVQLDDSSLEAECPLPTNYAKPSSHAITATYSGDSNFQGSNDSLTQNVVKAETSVDVVSSDTIAKFGQPVTFTARVTVDWPGSADPTGGKVDFKNGGTGIPDCSGDANARPVEQNTMNNSYEATCTVSDLSIGSHSITATYKGNDNLNESSGPETPVEQNVEIADTTTIVKSSDTSSTTRQQVTFTAEVDATPPGGGTPTGNVTFNRDGTPMTGCVDLDLSDAGEAQCSQAFNSAGRYEITAVYTSDSDNYRGSNSGPITQVVKLPYVVSATPNRQSDPTNARFRISNGPARDYTLCVKYLRYDGNTVWRPRTPPPKTGSTKWTINLNDKCKTFRWRRGASSTKSLYPHFGFAAKGIYQATWRFGGRNGLVIGTDLMNWSSWCPPQGMRNIGTWRPSRHKALDWCAVSSGYVGKGGNRSSLDADLGWRWMSGLGRLHVEYVALDSGWYSNPTTGRRALLRAPGGAGTNNRWTLWGKYVCDTYHGWKEFHRVYMAQQGNAIFITGGQYSTRTPSVSGSWSAHKC
ncbi:MAG: Ig-like domain-containing protein [Actinomycetota bacterium]|nr:Ig-like domain-containing protein [Actinomycetota bacterium]